MPGPGGSPLPPPGAPPVGGPPPPGGPPGVPGAAGDPPGSPAKKKPNIVFMVIDFLTFAGAVTLFVLLFLKS
ncbi:MAG TPA: hypothetical protein DCX67_09990 [Opitutae bacterium]|nr:hypothetical protein [Opitutae bacterium]